MKQIELTAGALWDLIPENVDLPETLTVQGIEFTIDQAAKISRVHRSEVKLTIQRLRRKRLAVRNDLMPPGIWSIFEPDGEFTVGHSDGTIGRNQG